ncbi:hypothetical protein BU24DRAFT_427890, partial [Aaosphaeria arxii CBS 175.79]
MAFLNRGRTNPGCWLSPDSSTIMRVRTCRPPPCTTAALTACMSMHEVRYSD